MVNWTLFLHKLGNVAQHLPSDREKVLHSVFSIRLLLWCFKNNDSPLLGSVIHLIVFPHFKMNLGF